MEQKIIILSDARMNRPVSEVSTAVGGKDLALNPTQISGLSSNYQAKLQAFQPVANVQEPASPVSEPTVQEPVVSEPAPVAEVAPVVDVAPVTEPVSEPVVDNHVMPVVEESVAPAMDTPVIDTPIDNPFAPVMDIPENPIPQEQVQPVVDASPVNAGVEIVPSEEKTTEYDELQTKIIDIMKKYDDEIVEINRKREEEIQTVLNENKEKILEAEKKILNLKDRAEEHLKNAQAAEQIATIAHQNAQAVQTTPFDIPQVEAPSISNVA